MARPNINDLATFVAVARESSFTRAGAKLGITSSAVSHAMRGLEERLGVRLLTRTTRSVKPTEAGERLLEKMGPLLDELDAELDALDAVRDRPAGTVRLTASEHPIGTVLLPALEKVLVDYPDVTVEIVTDYGLTDIVAERFDAGVRLGGIIDKDMIAVPIGPEVQSVVVASPDYLARVGSTPVHPRDLTMHRCINLRLPTYGGLYIWEFEEDGRDLNVRVDGPLVFNSIAPILDAALRGYGIAYVPRDQATLHLASGALTGLMPAFSPPYAGYHLYYPSRRQPTAAFKVVLDALRYRA